MEAFAAGPLEMLCHQEHVVLAGSGIVVCTATNSEEEVMEFGCLKNWVPKNRDLSLLLCVTEL